MRHPILVVVADKEEPARSRVRRQLSGLPHVVVAGETATGSALLGAVRQKRPDLLLMNEHFLSPDEARLIAERSYYTRLPMILPYSSETLEFMDWTMKLLPVYPARGGIPPAIDGARPSYNGNPLYILRAWADVLDSRAKLPQGERVLITRQREALGLLFSSAVLSIHKHSHCLTLGTRWADHEPVERLEAIFSEEEPGNYFEALPGTWLHLERVPQLRKKAAIPSHPPLCTAPEGSKRSLYFAANGGDSFASQLDSRGTDFEIPATGKSLVPTSGSFPQFLNLRAGRREPTDTERSSRALRFKPRPMSGNR